MFTGGGAINSHKDICEGSSGSEKGRDKDKRMLAHNGRRILREYPKDAAGWHVGKDKEGIISRASHIFFDAGRG